MNLKLPCAINAMALTETSQGTEEGDTVASLAVAASSVITTVIIAVGVLLLVPLQPILPPTPPCCGLWGGERPQAWK